MRRFLVIALACAGLSACAYPQSSIEQGSATGVFKIQDAPAGTEILIDGRPVGVRSKDVKADSFAVGPGTHTVEERMNGQMLLHKSYSVDAGATVTVVSAP